MYSLSIVWWELITLFAYPSPRGALVPPSSPGEGGGGGGGGGVDAEQHLSHRQKLMR
eukprot:COSAG01_NODE_66_length_29241_cov_17.772768_8_plen_57_part_00